MNNKVLLVLFLMGMISFVEAQTAGDGDGDGDGDGAAKAGDGDGDGDVQTTPPPTEPPTPVPTTPLPTPDLNNGQWSLHDINYYRRFVTKGDNKAAKQQLKDLMAMNETNETELLLLTPLSEAPTPAPPTPAPTPIPQDVVSIVKFASVGSAADFLKNNVAGALTEGIASTAQVVTTFTVNVKATVDPAPSDMQCKAAYALVFSLPESAVSCTVTPLRRLSALGRRLAGATVQASGQTTDATQADAAKAAAGLDSALTSSLQSVDSASFANVQATPEAPTMAAETQIVQQAADPEEAAKLSKAADDQLKSNTAAAATAAGVDPSTVAPEETVVEQVPTPTPTKVPTAMPTALPPGFTDTPTNLPTHMPSKMPTATPTKSPTAMPTKNPTASPTKNPTAMPTKNPTAMPTASPTASPTKSPTKSPTSAPTPIPPTSAPTMSPTNATEEESGAHKTAGFITAALLASFVAAQ